LANESCTVCHGEDRVAALGPVHGEPVDVEIPSFLPEVNIATDAYLLEGVEIVSGITDVTIGPPGGDSTVSFFVETANEVPINGIVSIWDEDPPDSNRYVRFTITKLMPGGTGTGDPDSWVAYTRETVNNGSTDPDYDTGASLVQVGDGSYVFTFNTDVQGVSGVPYDENLTHRVAGQIGSRSVPLEPQNWYFDFVPGDNSLRTRNIAVMDSCNECHDDLVFHGRRFLVEYCVQCHNPDLASGEGNMSFMTHRIHASGDFEILDNAISYEEVTYPQDLNNCRKCHDGGMPASVTVTSEGNNWRELPNRAACDGCHGVFNSPDDFDTYHTGAPPGAGNAACANCHPPTAIESHHLTANSTRHNPFLLANQRNISYEMLDATVITGSVEVEFRIESDGAPLDLTNLPQDLLDGNRYPGLLLAWAQPQDGIDEPADFTNHGRRGAQPLSIGLGDLSPIDPASTIGTLAFDSASGNMVAILTGSSSIFPAGTMMRTVGIQGYLRQDLDDDGEYDVSLHTPSAVITVKGDDERRQVVDNAKCGNCHEWFEGHGGNRVYEMAICTMCHVPNQSSSGRTIDTPSQGLLDDFADHGPIPGVNPNDPLTYPEDAQNLKDMVHGIHSSGFRTRDYQHVRGGREGYYNWSEVTFPRGASTANCTLCHDGDSYEIPLDEDVLATTVRTTSVEDGNDPDNAAVEGAFQNVPNQTDWVNTPMASACGYCHTWDEAVNHMRQSGGFLNIPK
jgi:OmcA/MtrC family decaheme c-type cytochrome